MNILYLALLLFLPLATAFSQTINVKEVGKNAVVKTEIENEDKFQSSERLKRIYRELVTTRNELNLIKKELDTDLDMLSRIKLESKFQKLEKIYEKKRFLFIETITNINLSHDYKKKNQTSFSDDIKQILDPALNTFKRISERPRQIQEHREQMDQLQIRFEEATTAKKLLEEFLKKKEFRKLKWKLKESIKSTNTLIKNINVKIEDLQFKITKFEKSEESLVTTFSTIIFEFIKTKGKNLILSLFVFLFFFWAFKFGQNKFIDLVLFKVSRSENKDMYNWIIRPTKVIYNAVSTLISFFMSILTLYVLNDWVLVTLTLILFAALVWSSKEYLPLFLEQSKIVLNLGSVREGERVIYNGLPWKIDSLGYYCRLSNPVLSGANLRVNTKELLSAHSRRIVELEPWFPSVVGDWMEVDGNYGEVIMQTPEQVIIELIGGEHKYIDSKTFYALSPKNYSKGFAVEFIFGLDYNVQKELFDSILPKFQDWIQKNLYQKHPEIQGNVIDTKVDFLRTNSSSLDLWFLMKCKGEIAHLRQHLERSLHAEFVKVCNENGLVIPFNQLTVHMNNG